jgi:hypothetical protein
MRDETIGYLENALGMLKDAKEDETLDGVKQSLLSKSIENIETILAD